MNSETCPCRSTRSLLVFILFSLLCLVRTCITLSFRPSPLFLPWLPYFSRLFHFVLFSITLKLDIEHSTLTVCPFCSLARALLPLVGQVAPRASSGFIGSLLFRIASLCLRRPRNHRQNFLEVSVQPKAKIGTHCQYIRLFSKLRAMSVQHLLLAAS